MWEVSQFDVDVVFINVSSPISPVLQFYKLVFFIFL